MVLLLGLEVCTSTPSRFDILRTPAILDAVSAMAPALGPVIHFRLPVRMEVSHLAGWVGGTLVARWSIMARFELTLLSLQAHTPTSGRDYEAMVVTMNQLIETLNRDIAVALQRLASPATVQQ